MKCNTVTALSQEQISSVFALLYREILDLRNSGKPFNFDVQDFTKALYKSVNDAVGAQKAMEYAQAVPQLVYLLGNTELSDYLIDNNFSMDKVLKLKKDFKNINKVKEYILGDVKTAGEVKSEIKNIRKDSKKLTPRNPPENNKIAQRQWTNGAKILFPLATTFQAAIFVNPYEEGNLNELDREKSLFYQVIKDLVYYSKDASDEGVVFYGDTPVALTAMPASALPYEYKTTADKEWQDKNGNDSSEIYGVLTNTDGEIIYFTESGEITNDPSKGRVVYQYIRKPVLEKGELVFRNRSGYSSNLVSPELVLENEIKNGSIYPSEEARNVRLHQIEDQQRLQMNALYTLRNLIAETQEPVMLNITGGSFGIFTQNKPNPVPVRFTEISEAVIKDYKFIETGPMSGYVKFDYTVKRPGGNIQQVVYLDRGLFDENLAEKVSEILTTKATLNGEELTATQRARFFEVFVFNKEAGDEGIYVTTARNKLIVKIKGKEIPQKVLYSPEGKEMIKKHLLAKKVLELSKNKDTVPVNVHYNKKYKNSTFIDYEVVGDKLIQKSINHFDFIKPYMSIVYAGDEAAYFNGLNAYLTFSIPMELLGEISNYGLGKIPTYTDTNKTTKAKSTWNKSKSKQTKLTRADYVKAAAIKKAKEEKAGESLKKNKKKTLTVKTTPAEKKEVDKTILSDKPKQLKPKTISPSVLDIGEKVIRKGLFERNKKLGSFLDRIFTNKADRERAEQWWKTHPMRKYISLERITEIVNSDAFATFYNSGITLYEADGGTAVDLYHEAWHAFSQMFLTPEEKFKLYDDLRAIPKWADAQFVDIEEAIAEDYRSYAKSRARKEAPKGFLGKIFERIYNFLQNLFKGVKRSELASRPRDIESIKVMFDNLYRASENPDFLETFKYSTQNIEFTQVLKRAKENISPVKSVSKDVNEFTAEESDKIAKLIDNIIGDIFYTNNAVSNISTTPVKVLFNNNNRVKLYEAVFDYLQNLWEIKVAEEGALFDRNLETEVLSDSDAFEQKQLSSIVSLIGRAIDNFGDIEAAVNREQKTGVVAYHLNNSTFEVLKSDYTESEDDPTMFKVDTGNIQNSKDIASTVTKTILSSVFKIKRTENNELEYSYDEFGFKELEDYDAIWNKLAKVLEGSFDKEEIYQRLKDNEADFPEFYQLQTLLPTLGDTYSDKLAFNIATSFWQDLKKPRLSYYQLNLNETGEGKTGGFDTLLSRSRFDITPVISDWETDFILAKPGTNKYIKKAANGVNVLDVVGIANDFVDKTTLNLNARKAKEFLTALGIKLDMTSPSIRAEVNSPNFISKYGLDFIYGAIRQVALAKPSDEQLQFRLKPFYYLRKGLPELLREDKEKSLEVRSRFNALAEMQVKFSDKYSNFSTLSPERNRVWEHFVDNTVTRVLTSMNYAKDWFELTDEDIDVNNRFQHMRWLSADNNTFTPFSVLVNSMYDINTGEKKDNKAVLYNMAGTQIITKNANEVEGTSTSSLDVASKFLQEMHTMLLQGFEEFMRHASKQTAQGLTMSNKVDTYPTKEKNRLYIDIKDFAPGKDGENDAYDIIKGYLSGEANRIFRFQMDPKFKNWAGYNREVTRKDKKKTKTMAGNAFTAFDDVLTEDLQDELYAIIDNAVKEKNVDFNMYDILAENPVLNRKVKADVKEYFNKLNGKVNKILNNTKFIDKKLLNETFTESVRLKPEEKEDMLVKAYNYNSWIHKFETTILAYGDLAQYNHAKEEFHKRNAGLGSGGLSFGNDLKDYAYINSLKKYYADARGIDYRDYDGTINTAILKEAVKDSIYYNEYREALVKAYTERLGDAKKAIQLADTALSEYYNGKGSKMKIGDGQGHVTMEMYRILKNLEGKWSNEQEELYKKVSTGEPIQIEDVIKYFPPYKLQYFGNIKTEGLPLTSFHKFSLAPIVPGVAKPGTPLFELHDKMMKDGVDYVVYETGSKIGHIGKGDEVFDNDGKLIKDSQFTVNTIFSEFLKNQTEINDEYKGKSIFSTQMRKLILEGLYRQGVIKSTDENKITNAIVLKYIDHVKEYTELLKLELLNEIGYKEVYPGVYEPDNAESLGKLLDLVRKNLEREDAVSNDIINFIDSTKNGELVNDLSYHPEASKIEKILLSLINKRVIKQKVKGEPLVQVSSAMYDGNITGLPDLRNATDAEKRKWIGTNGLPTYYQKENGKTAAMKVMIAIQGDYYNLFNLNYNDNETIGVYNSDGLLDMSASLTRLNEKIKDDAWLDADNEANRKAITLVGVRIPVQGLNSMEFMEVYEFLPPQAGNIIIPPAEIVAKSGGDFDIDKLSIFMSNIDKQGKLKQRLHADNETIKAQIEEAIKNGESTDEIFKQQKAGLENELMADVKEILELPENFVSLITPNGTFLLKEIADQLSQYVMDYNPFETFQTTAQKEKDKYLISPTRVLEAPYNLYKHESNNVGKKTLGLGAIENTFNVLFNSLGAYLPKNYYKGDDLRKTYLGLRHNKMKDSTDDEVVSLSDIYDVDNVNKIADVFSQAINGWVDVEKDAWIFFIQGNYEVSPVLLYLIKAGVPVKEAIYFVSQPLVREYVKEQQLANSTYARVLGKKPYGNSSAQSAARKAIFAKYFNPSVATPKMKEKLIHAVSNKVFDKYMSDKKRDHFTEQEMFDLIVDYKNDNKAARSELSQAMFLHFLNIEGQISNLTKLKVNANPDTNVKTMISAVEQNEENLESIDPNLEYLVKKFRNDSVISSFFNGPLALALSRPLFKLRYHPRITEYLSDKGFDLITDMKQTFGANKRDLFTSTFRNDMVSYLFQNALRKYVDSDAYMSIESKNIKDVKQMKSGVLGAFVKTNADGTKVLYIDEKKLQQEFEDEVWARGSQFENSYSNLGLYPLNLNTFKTNNKNNFNQYKKFVIEREYLRSVYPIEPLKQTRETYEKFLANKALDNIYNIFHLFKDKENAFSVRYNELINKYPTLLLNFEVLKKLQNDSKESADERNDNYNIFNLKLIDKDVNTKKANLYTKNTKNLADPVFLRKLGYSVEEATEISNFFAKLPIFAYLQAGINKTSYSLANIVDYQPFLDVVKEEGDKFIKLLDNSETAYKALDDVYDAFMTQNYFERGSDRNRYKDFLVDETTTSKITSAKTTQPQAETEKDMILSEKEKFDMGAYIINMQFLNNGDLSLTVSNWLTAINESNPDLSKTSFNNMLDQVLTNKLIKKDADGVIEYVRDLGNTWFDKNKPETKIEPKGTINVYWGQAESATSTKILSNLAPRKFTWKGKEYGSVEHAYQSNKSGTFDQATYDKYLKVGGYGTKIRGKAVTKGFDNLKLMKDLVVESFKQNKNSEAATKLLQYANFTHNTNEIIDKAFLEGLKLAQQSLLTTQPQAETSVIKTVSEPYGVVQVETNPTKADTQEVINLIAAQIEKQAYKENVGVNANWQFSFGNMWSRVNLKAKPLLINSFAGVNKVKAQIEELKKTGKLVDKSKYIYDYHELDQNGNPLPPISDLQPLINKIQNALGIDMSDYDSVLGNIYLDKQSIAPHRDTTEAKSAEGYPVIVYTIGNDSGLGIWDDNKGKMTFQGAYKEDYQGRKPTNEILTKDGTVYTFGMEGKGRFALSHTTPLGNIKKNPFPPIKLSDGRTLTNYTITLTFRRAADLEPGMPSTPAKLKTIQPQVEREEEPVLLLEKTEIPNLFLYDDTNVTEDYYKNMMNRHSDVTFVIAAPQKEILNNFTGAAEGQSYFGKLANSMTIAIPTDLNKKGDALRDLPGTSYDKYKTIIENKIININEKLKLGKPVAISIKGFGDPYRMPQELFVYLSKRLFESFGYVNPGSVMDTTEKNEDDIDKEILEALGLESNIFKC